MKTATVPMLTVLTAKFLCFEDGTRVPLGETVQRFAQVDGVPQHNKATASAVTLNVTAESLGVSEKRFKAMQRMYSVDQMLASGMSQGEVGKKIATSPSNVSMIHLRKYTYKSYPSPEKLALLMNPEGELIANPSIIKAATGATQAAAVIRKDAIGKGREADV